MSKKYKFSSSAWEAKIKEYICCPGCGLTWDKVERIHKANGFPGSHITKDHVIPKSKGGSGFLDNIRPFCRPCNCARGNGEQIPSLKPFSCQRVGDLLFETSYLSLEVTFLPDGSILHQYKKELVGDQAL